ncbi:MAG TPA: hypothetical protein VFQ80_00065 [Thermomicrobiales bacterium]|nr:hypothetical protein [Thermomicrobiales bacterium]
MSNATFRRSLRTDRRHLLGGVAGLGFGALFRPLAGFAQSAPAPDDAPAESEAAWIRFNLNLITAEQILAIPGAGERMTREFPEYRPYTTIRQFRQEIGKYVEPAVVAGYERYVFAPVAPNDADADTLGQLPGVDADIAQALIGGRPYADDPAFLAALGKHVSPDQPAAAPAYLAAAAHGSAPWIKFNLNTATDAQFQTIPGVGGQMLREFAEYRPYTSLAQFQKEIGKYVDAAQVAAYQAYLFVPVDPNAADAATLAQLPGVDADRASRLIGGRPYADAAALVAALKELVGVELANAAPAYLVNA